LVRRAQGTRLAPDQLQKQPKLVLCVLPPGWRGEGLRSLLATYELVFASDPGQALRRVRRRAYDLYLLHSPLEQTRIPLLCRRIRDFDAQTPLIVYSIQPTRSEREDALHAGAQAYVTRSENSFNLAATAGQLVMLAELRSMEALGKVAKAIQDHLSASLAALGVHLTDAEAALRLVELQQQLKRQACAMFSQAGGSRAHFERLWPSLLQAALESDVNPLVRRPRVASEPLRLAGVGTRESQAG
jgi:CheY-like chemotaxis protein